MFNLECQILSFWWVVILSSERKKNIGEKKVPKLFFSLPQGSENTPVSFPLQGKREWGHCTVLILIIRAQKQLEV